MGVQTPITIMKIPQAGYGFEPLKMHSLRITTRKAVIAGINGIYENSELAAKCTSRYSGAQKTNRLVSVEATKT